MDNSCSVASPALDREAVEQAVARGSELLKQGKLDDAQKAFRAALMIDSENPRVLALLGLTYFRAGKFAPGAADLRGARRARADRRLAPAQPRPRLS